VLSRRPGSCRGFFLARVGSPGSVAGTGPPNFTAVSHHRLHFIIGLLVACVGYAPAASSEIFPGLSRKWQYYQSPNFELYSANNERDSRDVLEKMELLRAVFLDTFKFTVRLPQPVTIYYFDRDKDFDGYRPPNLRGGDSKFAGFCTNYSDRTIITLAPTRDRDAAREIVYHEYIHYLFRITEQKSAPWFNEGAAELFSTLREDGEWLQMGHPVIGAVNELRRSKLMPFEQLFAVQYDSPLFRNAEHTGIFYAQSWAFLHYCRYGVNKIPPEKMALFLRAAGSAQMQEKPAEFRAFCKELLGYDYPELLRQVERYVVSGKFMARKVLRPSIPAKATYSVRPVDVSEMEEKLAELSLRITGSAYANLQIRDRLSRRPDARLHELMGMVAERDDEIDVAREHWRRAVELGTNNAAIFRELGRLESNEVFDQFNLDYRMPLARAERMRTLLKKSIECAPAQSMGYEMLAWVEASLAVPNIPNVILVQDNFKGLNDKPRTVLALALVRYRLGQTKDALGLLDELDKLTANPWAKHCAEITRARIEGRAVDVSKLPSGLPPRAGGVVMLPPMIDPPR
jgi:hypothetical protein